MAPSRGSNDAQPSPSETTMLFAHLPGVNMDASNDDENGPKYVAPDGESFTIRAVAVGLLVGLVICFSNMYFGLQTGWVSTMTMPASLLGFGIFKLLERQGLLAFPFTPVENVLVQTVAGSMAIMPLGCGFVGVIPAMTDLLTPAESGPLSISLPNLVLWSLGLCYFGVLFAVPLRKQVLIREKLKFPSGFSTAVLIGVLHGRAPRVKHNSDDDDSHGFGALASPPASGSTTGFSVDGDQEALIPRVSTSGFSSSSNSNAAERAIQESYACEPHPPSLWASNIRLLLLCFLISGLYTLASYFLPMLRNIPIFGFNMASSWLWTLNPSPAYVGQGVIMGPATTLHMLLGAIVGWGILSPLAKRMGWAPGPVGDWETGSKGWIVWVSLAVMLADSIVSLSFIAFRPLVPVVPRLVNKLAWKIKGSRRGRVTNYQPLPSLDDSVNIPPEPRVIEKHALDAPAEQLIPPTVVWIGLLASIIFCIFTIHAVFGTLVPLYATVLAVLMALVLSVMGVRALGETDLNPVSGISKLAQLFFAFVIPQGDRRSVLVNLVAGAVSEAGALQAGDLMQDLKTGHLLAASPASQFWGQCVGATAGALVSAFIYRLYTAVYPVPGELFQVPTAYVWIFTARLVTGKGLPPMATTFAAVAGLLFVGITVMRTICADRKWINYVPGGIAVAVGMYNVPSFTLARTIGGLVAWFWRRRLKRQDTGLIVLASGFILGEGFLSIVNLILRSCGVPHL